MMRRRGVGVVGVAAVAHTASKKGAQQQATAELQNLANLHAQGILTDEEYSAAKAKALGI